MLSPSPNRLAPRGVLCLLILQQLCATFCKGAEEAAPLADIPLPSNWIKSLEVRASSGYKDNVLLANQNVEASPFLAGGLDLTFIRLPESGWDGMLTVSGDYTHYLTATNVDQEATAVVEGQVKKSFESGWRVGLTADYLYFNQVFDNSVVSTQLVALPVVGNSFTLRPSVAKPFGDKYRLELEFPATRQIFDQFIDNYWEFGPRLTFGRELPNGCDLAAVYQFTDRLHDTRPARDASGNVENGHGLQFHQSELSFVWRQFWDDNHRWRTITKLGLERNDDNGGGYYDFWRPLASAQMRYRAKTWEVRSEARIAYYHWDSQRIAEPESPIRHKTYVRMNFRGEKNLTRSLKLFAEYEYERAISNLDIDQYTVNTISAGLNWEF
jgi:hypothetical protein